VLRLVLGPDGLQRAGWVGVAQVGLTGSAQKDRRSFFNFQNSFSRAKINLEKSRQFIKSTKNTLKITKIPEKFPEIN
jgi:hypothetical protein